MIAISSMKLCDVTLLPLDELENDDFVFDLNKEIATLLYKAWSTSIKVLERYLSNRCTKPID